MTDFENAIMNRDGLSKAEARRQKNEAREALYEILEDSGSYDDVEDMLAYDYGLEMDYIFDLL